MRRGSRARVALAAALLVGAGATALVLATALPAATDTATGSGAAGKKAKPAIGAAGEELALGQLVYEKYCIGCHGVKGDGKGEAARFLDPKPRDFTSGVFKFASVPSGQLPRDDDLLKTITRGLRGTSMPSFRFVPEEQRRAVIRYLKTFAPESWANPVGVQIERSPDPYAEGNPNAKPVEEALREGKKVYHETIKCYLCHPSYMSEAELQAKGLETRVGLDRPKLAEDAWGNWIRPPDFKRHALRAATNVDELYQVVTAGVGGTGMPTLARLLTNEQRWQLAYYLKSLADERATVKGPLPPPIDPRKR